MENDIKSRTDILETATKCTAQDRNQTYGEPYHNLSVTANLVNSYLQAKHGKPICLTGDDIAIIMSLNKVARMATGSVKPHIDNYVDGAAYLAIAGEIAIADFTDPARTETTYDPAGQVEEKTYSIPVSCL